MAAGNQRFSYLNLVTKGIAVLAGRPNTVLFPPHSPGTSQDSKQRPGGL